MSSSNFKPPEKSSFSLSDLFFNPHPMDVSPDSCPPSMYLTEPEYRYLKNLKSAQPISMTLSNVEIMNDNEPQCIFTDDQENSKVVLKNCSKAIKHRKTLSDGRSKTPEFLNNLFYYDLTTKHILSMNKIGTCLYVKQDANGKEYLSQGSCHDNPNYKFHFNDSKQIVSEIYPEPTDISYNLKAKCITASGFIEDRRDSLYSRLEGTPRNKKDISLYLEDCEKLKDLSGSLISSDAGIFSSRGDQLFNYGNLPVQDKMYDQTGESYIKLEKEYKDFEKDTVKRYNEEIARILADVDIANADVVLQQEKNRALLDKGTAMKKKEFTNIQTQTNMIHEQNASDSDENNQHNRKTGFQQVHQDRFQYLHKVLFWIYYIITAIFVLVFMIQTSHLLIVKVLVSLLVLTYPFVVFVLEYYAAFAFYYSLSFIEGKPYDGNRSLPFNLSFYKPSQLV